MRKRILKDGLFLLLLALMLNILGPVFLPKDNTPEAGRLETDPTALLSQPENSIDLLFLGDSEAYSGFVPLELWKNQGIASFVCASVDQKPYETVWFLETALTKQTPKAVVLETNVLYRVYARRDLLEPYAQRLFPVLRHHDRWKNLSLRDLEPPQYTGAYPDRGYHLLTAADPLEDLTGYMAPMNEWEPLSRANMASFRKIYDLCAEMGIQLILYSVPSPMNWTVRRHNTMEDLARDFGITYLDGNLLDLGIDWTTDTYDRGDHLNYWGAQKNTLWLGTWLTQNCPLPDHREDSAYESWTEDLETLPQRIQEKQAGEPEA